MNSLLKPVKGVVDFYFSGDYDQSLQRAAITVQLVLLCLSLVHQTNAMAEVTKMNWYLAFGQAFVADIGLFIAELFLIEFIARGYRWACLWPVIFMTFAATQSGAANIFDYTSHLTAWEWRWYLSAWIGGTVPVQVLLLGGMISHIVHKKDRRKVIEQETSKAPAPARQPEPVVGQKQQSKVNAANHGGTRAQPVRANA
jgi:carbon starvation protein CstA